MDVDSAEISANTTFHSRLGIIVHFGTSAFATCKCGFYIIRWSFASFFLSFLLSFELIPRHMMCISSERAPPFWSLILFESILRHTTNISFEQALQFRLVFELIFLHQILHINAAQT
jgi:hypothetical protein